MKNRVDLPDDFRGTLRLGDGEVKAFRDGTLLALAWRAAAKKKPVIMLSTQSSATTEVVPARRSGYEAQTKPVVVVTYNHHMNGVDIADQHAVYYSFIRKTVKWWRKLFFWLLETAMVNSYILHNHVLTPSRPNHLTYRRAIVHELPCHTKALRIVLSQRPRSYTSQMLLKVPIQRPGWFFCVCQQTTPLYDYTRTRVQTLPPCSCPGKLRADTHGVSLP